MKEKYFFKEGGRVEMLLPGKKYRPYRCIGHAVKNTFRTERASNCIFRAVPGGGIGLPYNLMKMGGGFDFVEVKLLPEGRILRTSRASILEFGKILDYSRNGLERQIIMPIGDFGREPAKSGEPTLFDEA